MYKKSRRDVILKRAISLQLREPKCVCMCVEPKIRLRAVFFVILYHHRLKSLLVLKR